MSGPAKSWFDQIKTLDRLKFEDDHGAGVIFTRSGKMFVKDGMIGQDWQEENESYKYIGNAPTDKPCLIEQVRIFLIFSPIFFCFFILQKKSELILKKW